MSESFHAWVRANCPVAGLPAGLVEHVSQVEARGENYHVLIGAAGTTIGQACLIHRFAGQYFRFLLSDEQARLLDATGPVLRFAEDCGRAAAVEPRSCTLERVAFVQDDAVILTGPIQGSCICRFEGAEKPETCLRLEMNLSLASDPETMREVCFYCYPAFGSDGSVQFAFAPRKMDQFARGQLTAAFLSVSTPPDEKNGKPARPLSNAAGVLVKLE